MIGRKRLMAGVRGIRDISLLTSLTVANCFNKKRDISDIIGDIFMKQNRGVIFEKSAVMALNV